MQMGWNDYPARTTRCETCGAAWSYAALFALKFWAWWDRLRGRPCSSGRCKFVRIRPSN